MDISLCLPLRVGTHFADGRQILFVKVSPLSLLAWKAIKVTPMQLLSIHRRIGSQGPKHAMQWRRSVTSVPATMISRTTAANLDSSFL